LIHREFISYIDHDFLKHLGSQSKLNTKHSHWMTYLQQFEFVIKHKLGTKNKVVGTLNRQPHLMHLFSVHSTWFKDIKIRYVGDNDFSNIRGNFNSKIT